jgi:hypothetical protein
MVDTRDRRGGGGHNISDRKGRLRKKRDMKYGRPISRTDMEK